MNKTQRMYEIRIDFKFSTSYDIFANSLEEAKKKIDDHLSYDNIDEIIKELGHPDGYELIEVGSIVLHNNHLEKMKQDLTYKCEYFQNMPIDYINSFEREKENNVYCLLPNNKKEFINKLLKYYDNDSLLDYLTGSYINFEKHNLYRLETNNKNEKYFVGYSEQELVEKYLTNRAFIEWCFNEGTLEIKKYMEKQNETN